jgi:AAA ATPase domain
MEQLVVRLDTLCRFWLVEPLIWLLRCFFEPVTFQKNLERETIGERLHLMLRLALPLFCCTYPLAMFLRVIVYLCFTSLYKDYGIHPSLGLQPGMLLFAFDCFWADAVSCLLGGLFGGLFSVVYGVSLALSLALANGIIINNQDDTLVGIIFGLSFGCFLGLTFNSIAAMKRSGLIWTTLGTGAGILVGMGTGVVTGILGGYWSGFLVGFVGGPALQQSDSILGSVAGIIVGGIAGSLLVRFFGFIVRGGIHSHAELIGAATRIGVAVAAAFGVALGTPVGDVGMKHGSLFDGFSAGITDLMVVGVAFLLSYIPSYYRLPLYPLSAASMLRAYLSSRKDATRVFYDLRHCALCCDECVFLPLPYVREMLLIAADQNVERTLEVIEFLLQERPQQRSALLAAVLEIALQDLCQYESLRDISHAHERLLLTLPHDVRLRDPQISRLFRDLEDASRDAASYYLRGNRRARNEALESMQAHLKHVYPERTFDVPHLNHRLEELVQRWRVVAKHEQENISRDLEEVDYIINPYMPGLVLELRDPLFVGRQNLAQQMSEALLRSRRPTFFLSGERRMGKSSILKQLPDLLGSQYLPIFYDLQMTGIASSAAALLAALAEGIYDKLIIRGIALKPLEYEQLREDQRQNEAVVYHRFGRWLKDVELALEQDRCVLLLMFDEFEKFEEAGQKGYLDLGLLLDWLRSTIQNRPRIALLFSGVKSVSDLGLNWSGYFVNVENLKISFLQRSEASRLITHPTPSFPGEHIFSKNVVEAIIDYTGCHPFLIQALGSVMISQLNNEGRKHVRLEDVEKAVEEVFRRWGDNYFGDLWMRTDDEQRLCLHSILLLEDATPPAIQEKTGLTEQATRHALQRLQKRDILLCVQGRYTIATPIFKLWVQRSI